MADTLSHHAAIRSICRYPVKGLSPENLDQIGLETGKCIAFDRAWAIENGGGAFDPANPQHLPKNKFLMLMSHERLAILKTRFEEDTQMLHILRDGKEVSKGRLDQRIGRQLLEQFLSAYMSNELRGAPRIVHAPGHSFCDAPEQFVSLINLATVRDLERVVGQPVDPLRFRANLYVDGIDPWAEFDWVGRTLETAAGPLFKCESRIDRCAATNVDPETGVRDMAIPRALMQAFGHIDCGVYLRVIADGKIVVGETLTAGTG